MQRKHAYLETTLLYTMGYILNKCSLYVHRTYDAHMCQKQLQFHDFLSKIIPDSDLRGQTVMYILRIWYSVLYTAHKYKTKFLYLAS